ncbi:gpi anchored serine-rich protein [Fusarium circinatum]|uniref:Gpi anchored serine-rich protein n=1 Tax=Fusarium circinatum TaxID=48490 RepID=A0A8H5SYW2_FUSCI|nr:gpi anchored serine-rich protein [Fusarium circinatum]
MRYSTAAAALLASGAMATEYSKVYETKRVTITSCGPEVTNCPARSTVTSNTVYPVPPQVTSAAPQVTSAEQGSETTEEVPEVPETTEAPLTTSTIYSTNIRTITSCAPEVTNCPARSGTPVVVTETIAVSTTICPVEPTGGSEKPGKPGKPEKPSQPGYEQPSGPAPPAETKPVETQPGYEQPPAPPAETKPGSEQPPAPPAETKPAQPSKPVVPGQPQHPGNGTVPHPPVYPNPPATQSGEKPVVPPTPVPVPSNPGNPEQCVPSQSVTAITKEYTTVLTSVEYSTIQVPCATGTAPGNPSNPGQPGSPTGPAVPPPATTPIGGGNQTVPTPPVVTAGAATFAGSAFFAAVAGLAAFILV